MAGTTMQQRRGTAQVWATANPMLKAGEFGVETDTGVVKCGDGVNNWNALQPILRSTYLPILGKAADADKLDGHDSTEFLLKTEGATTYLPLATAATTYERQDAFKSTNTPNAPVIRDANGAFAAGAVTGLTTPTTDDSAANRKFVNDLVLPAGANRTLVNHFGSVTVFPTTGVKIGDRCFRSDLFCEYYYNGGIWRQVDVGRATKAQRLAIATTNDGLYTGFTLLETDTNRRWYWDSLAATPGWRYLNGGLVPSVKLLGLNLAAPTVGADAAWTSWGAPEIDSDGFWDAANSQIKIPTGLSARYRLAFWWNTAGGTSTTNAVYFRVIKAARTSQTTPPTNQLTADNTITNVQHLKGTWEGQLNAGDFVSFQYWTNQTSFPMGGSNFGGPSYVTLDLIPQ